MLVPATGQTGSDPGKVLGASTISATACFAAWTIFSIIGLAAKVQLGLSETEFGLLVGVPILSGSIARVPLGVWPNRSGRPRASAAQVGVRRLATVPSPLPQTYGPFLSPATASGIQAAPSPQASPTAHHHSLRKTRN